MGKAEETVNKEDAPEEKEEKTESMEEENDEVDPKEEKKEEQQEEQDQKEEDSKDNDKAKAEEEVDEEGKEDANGDEKDKGNEEEEEEEEVSKSKKKTKKTSPTKGGSPKKKRAAPPVPESARPEREKRSRKSAEAFRPEDFKQEKPIKMIDGRGKTLQSIESTRLAIEKHPVASEEVQLAFRFLFGKQGKPSKREIKAYLLEFNGFLEKKKDGQTKEQMEKQDDEAEAKMGAKAYKLTVPQLKSLCDFFALDRTGCSDKDSLVDCLLNFLGHPKDDAVKQSGKKRGKAASKQKDESNDDEDEDDEGAEEEEEEEEEAVVEGEMPSDAQLRSWVRAYVRCFNMEKVTIKHAMEIAGEKFGVDLAVKKDLIKKFMTEEM